MGSKKSKTTVRRETILDPATKALNEYRLTQERRFDPIREKAAELSTGFLRPGPFEGPASELENVVRRNIERFSGPALEARLTAAGLGRSGAVGEAIAGEGTKAAIPFFQYLNTLADPSRLSFTGAPTDVTTTKSKTGFNPLDIILPVASLAAAPFIGPALSSGVAAAGRGASNLFGSFFPSLDPFAQEQLKAEQTRARLGIGSGFFGR